jgi:hypothetical protein
MRVLRVPSDPRFHGLGRINVPALHARSPRQLARAALVLMTTLALWLGWSTRDARAFEIAVQDDPTFLLNTGKISRQAGFQRAQQLGATVLRINVIWADWVRNGPAIYDAAISEAARHGMAVHLTLTGTPSGTRGARQLGNNRPSPKLFAAFVTAVSSQFRGRVARYSLWNEPNLRTYLSPQSSAPTIYRNLYRAGYAALKRTDPGAKVLLGELFSGNVRGARGRPPLEFLNRMSGNLRADGLAYHPFQYADGPRQRSSRYVALASMSSIRSTMRALARRRALRTPSGGPLPIYFTEFGYQITGSYGVRPESRRASWTVEAFRMAKRGGARSMLYYHLVRNYGRGWDTGIVNRGGSTTQVFNTLVGARRSLIGR